MIELEIHEPRRARHASVWTTSSADRRPGSAARSSRTGYWWAELESNATMDAEYILMTHFLGARDEAMWRGVAQDIRGYQRDDGSWALYAGAPGDLSTTIARTNLNEATGT